MGDVLFMFDVDIIPKTSMWMGIMPTQFAALRGTWLVAMKTLLSTKSRFAVLSVEWIFLKFGQAILLWRI